MLGATLVHLFEEEYDVFSTGTKVQDLNEGQKYFPFDLRSKSYHELISWSDPDVVLHCAALTNGNYCESNPLDAFEVNGLTSKKLADSVPDKTKIIYVSTDAVFPSELHLAKEDDCTRPESVYGKSKELGEFFLFQSDKDFTVVRTTIVGLNRNDSRRGFVEWILDSARRNETIQLFDDVVFTPISIWDLAKHLEIIFTSNAQFSRKAVHITGKEVCTKYHFGTELIKSLGLSAEGVKRGSITKMDGRAKRSTDQSLACDYYIKTAKEDLPGLKETIESIKKNYKQYEKHQIRK